MSRRVLGHVPIENLDEFRAINKAVHALDNLQHWYYVRGRNPPQDILLVWRDLVRVKASLRAGGRNAEVEGQEDGQAEVGSDAAYADGGDPEP